MSHRRFSPSSPSRHFSLDKILERIDRSGGSDKEVKHRIAAMVLAYSRNWSPARIAKFFDWPEDEVTKWLEAGKFQRAIGPKKDESK